VNPITIKKLDFTGQLVTAYQGRIVERTPTSVHIRARWRRPTLDLGYVVLETGDLFIETHHADRWYALFEIHASDGTLKGWYVNFSRPAAISASEISAVDLHLDLFVYPDGRTLLLDEDEYAALDLPHVEPAAHQAIQSALADLRTCAAQRRHPFEDEGRRTKDEK
jgi:predicted RNA-binding protein associated with RNAse of E/G family